MSQNIWRKKDTELTYSANTAQRKNKFFSRCLKGEKNQEYFTDNGTEQGIPYVW